MNKRQNQIEQNIKKKPFYEEFISGWFAGCGRILTGQPFDIIKTRLQAQTDTKIYSGAGDCFKRILKNEGITAFYKGTAGPLLIIGGVCAVHFTTSRELKKLLIVRIFFSNPFFLG